MKRQPKSGSKAQRNRKSNTPIKGPRMIEHPDGSREITLDAEMLKTLEKQKLAFRAKFGRDPSGRDPLFFDPDCDVPTPLSDEKLAEARKVMVDAMERTGVPPEIIHAYQRTGRILTEQNKDLVPAKGIEEWNAAVVEYFEWQRMGEDALKAGAHPAIAYAISKTGKLRPDGAQFSEDMTHATASGLDADWLEAANEYVKQHPETSDPTWLKPADPSKDRIH